MFDWLKRSPQELLRAQDDPEGDGAPVFRPAQLPPRRPEATQSRSGRKGARLDYQHAEFILQLEGDWEAMAGQGKEQFIWESSGSKSGVVISVIPLSFPPERLMDIARTLLESRQQSERVLRKGNAVKLENQRLELWPDKDAVEIGYSGSEGLGTIFRFAGFVTRRKVLSLWLATRTLNDAFSQQVFDDVRQGLKFNVP